MSWRRILIIAEIALVTGMMIRGLVLANQKLEWTRFAATRAEVLQLRDGVMRYKAATGTFPPTETGLSAIAPNAPTDAWGHKYHYKYPGSHGDEPDIWSDGPDGHSPIGNWIK